MERSGEVHQLQQFPPPQVFSFFWVGRKSTDRSELTLKPTATINHEIYIYHIALCIVYSRAVLLEENMCTLLCISPFLEERGPFPPLSPAPSSYPCRPSGRRVAGLAKICRSRCQDEIGRGISEAVGGATFDPIGCFQRDLYRRKPLYSLLYILIFGSNAALTAKGLNSTLALKMPPAVELAFHTKAILKPKGIGSIGHTFGCTSKCSCEGRPIGCFPAFYFVPGGEKGRSFHVVSITCCCRRCSSSSNLISSSSMAAACITCTATLLR